MDAFTAHDDSSKQDKAARLVGRLFGKKDKKPTSQEDVDSFLHGPSDALRMTGTAPVPTSTSQGRPTLGKLDISATRRWPSAADVIQSQQAKDASRPRSQQPPPRQKKKKNLTVHYKDPIVPEIIGEGGDDFEEPTIQISRRKQAHAQKPASIPAQQQQNKPGLPERSQRPPISERMPTGPAPPLWDLEIPPPLESRSGNSTPTIRTPQETELVTRMQRQMEISEGQALIADRRASALPSEDSAGGQPQQQQSVGRADPSNGMLSVGGMVSNALRPDSLPAPAPVQALSPVDRPPIASRPTTQSTNSGDNANSSFSPDVGAHHSTLPYDNEALEEFSCRIMHYYKLFKLSAESVEPLSLTPFAKLLRIASWWFLRGRTAIEQVVKRRAEKKLEGVELLKAQGIADLAKCYWLLDEILMERPEIDRRSPDQLYAMEKNARVTGDNTYADSLERYQALYASLRKLTASMMKNDVMPPESDEAILVQGLNTGIWIAYPWNEPKMREMLGGVSIESVLGTAGKGTMAMADALPLGDTASTFVYNRTHVGVFLSSDKSQAQGYRLPCVLSIQRERAENGLSALISSQDGSIALCVSSKQDHRPHWKDVKWDVKRDFMDVKLPLGFSVRIVFPPGELASVNNLYEYTTKVQRNFRPRDDEELFIETTVRSVQYKLADKNTRTMFPRTEILHCRVRVFEKTIWEQTSSGNHHRLRGLRIALTTGPSTRSFCGLSHEIPTSRPMRFEHMRLEYGSSLFLYFDDQAPATLALTFETNQDRWTFHNALVGGQRTNESTQAVLPLQRYTVTGASDADFASTRTVLENFRWKQLELIIHNQGTDVTNRRNPTPPHMRIIAEAENHDRVTDRLLIAPGELKFRLNTRAQSPSLSILRKPQQDLTISCPESKTSSTTRQGFTQLLGLIAKIPTIRTYVFATLPDMHEFQRALTGFKVMFDGTASTLSIARRRSLVPIHKKWEAIDSRIQIMDNGAQVQIAIFFENFAHGECMNFRIKATDNFETFAKSGKFGVKLADAKFALPETGEEKDEKDGDKDKERIPRQAAFIGTDLLEWVSENDDILLTFETEAERDRFAKCLPSETKMGRRFGTIKR